MTTQHAPTATLPFRLLPAFEEQVDRTPHACAVAHGKDRLSYASLDERANRLAHLLKSHGIGRDALVAIAIPRSLDMVIAVLAALKAGGGYVPLDPEYPSARLAFMMSDTKAPVLLTVAALAASLPAAPTTVCVDTQATHIATYPSSRLDAQSMSDALAYVVYTSGSTGQPKGVAMPLGPLENLIDWQLRDSAVGASERTLQFAPLSFDVHFQEIFGTLCAGGELVLVDDDQRLDAGRLLTLLDTQNVARLFLPFIALQNLADVAVAQGSYPRGLREVVTAGEQLVVTKAIAEFFENLPRCTLHNHYGPSETHVVTSYTLRGRPAEWPRLPPIGKPIQASAIYVLDPQQRPVAAGVEGELYLGGACVARGYLHRPELTDEKFVPDPFAGTSGARMYRTGDLARLRSDGDCEFLGRLDTQVKVRGYRVELGEVEVALDAHPGLQQAVVIAREDEPGDKRLVAYVVLKHALPNLAGELRRHLGSRVPEYMMPSAFVALTDFPRTPSGKIERRSLPRPEGKRPELETRYLAPHSDVEVALSRLWARLIKIDRVGVHDNFFDLGGNSLLALQTVALLRQERGLDLPVVQVFANPTVAALAAHLEGRAPKRGRTRRKETGGAGACEPIAVIGLGGRFPGADDIRGLWEVLDQGRDTTTAFAVAELDPLVPAASRDDSAYVRRRGIIRDGDKFDAAFFGIHAREAELMDPQQRILLETAWAALEDAGYVPERIPGSVGVFAGTHNNSYVWSHVMARPDAVQAVGAFAVMVGNEKDYVATRIAHKLNLTGPALSVHTACSTSLVAIALAVQQLRQGECDVALAGGAALTVPERSGHVYQEGGMLSPDGHTRSFDADARGTVFSDGVGMVALKRLADAERDGDHVYAVIRAAALNNDGADKVSFTAPSVDGQAAVIASAHAQADIDPRSISYVEAHGTATPLGDPVEVEGLTRAFREGTEERGYCALGSIKSNFGHLTAAAGVAGVIKTALALSHGSIPPTVHFKRPNPAIDFAKTPFYVVAKSTPWPRSDVPRRAGVSSFGVGGTNAHVVIEEAPLPAARAERAGARLLLLSARNKDALVRVRAGLQAHLATHTDLSLSDVAYTLHVGRRAFSERAFVVADSVEDACAQLAKPTATRAAEATTERQAPPVVFLFPGQGAQYVGMGAALYRDEPLFRVIVDQCADVLLPHLGEDLRAVLFPAADAPAAVAAAAHKLQQTEFTQAALFTLEYALASLWISWGVKPALMIGHSVGEFVCAVLASVMRLEDALFLVAQRGKLMQALPPGAMLSVRLPEADVRIRLPAGCAIASVNAPSLCVVAGPEDAVGTLARALEAEGVVTRALHTSHAFHSAMMEPAVLPFEALVQSVPLSAPRIPFVSTLTGQLADEAQVTDPHYWAVHLRDTVRFSDALRTALEDPSRVLLEVGPRNVLATLARQHVTPKSKQLAVSSLADSPETERASLLAAVGRLWLAGSDVDVHTFYQADVNRRVSLPTYPFERKRHWLALSAVPVPLVSNQLEGKIMIDSTNALAAHKREIITKIKVLLEDASGIELTDADHETSFFELGLDSLLLTQVAMSVKRQFGVDLSFRLLLEDLGSLELLASHLAHVLPAPALPAHITPAVPAPAVSALATAAVAPAELAAVAGGVQTLLPVGFAPSAAGSVQAVVEAQLQLMQMQLALLSGATPMALPEVAPAQEPVPSLAPLAHAPKALSNGAGHHVDVAPTLASPYLDGDEPVQAMKYDVKKAFGAIARIHTTDDGQLNATQRAALNTLIHNYTQRTRGSKEWTTAHRKELADPRVVTGFRPLIKELVYSIVAARSAGSRIWDIDGNEYVDALNGFGSNFLGHAPQMIKDALKAQIDVGYEIGPMQPVIGACARLVCELTGLERAAFCNTGSEAVMGAMRIARTVTGRNLIAVFSGSYHGIFDEVIVRGTKRLRSIPAAPGIMPESVENVLVLDYGTPESMAILKERAGELAAVMVEPVQSRRPDFQPVEFLRELRAVTSKAGCAYIWDEVITGFRAHLGGAQARFGVRADLATYGKVAGGGMPLGIIAGKREWMDALDGGHWQFGDDSTPTAGVTYFAGTFVRHPLTMAATHATLSYLKRCGPALQERIDQRTERLATTLNAHFAAVKAPLKIKHFSSLWKTFYLEDHAMQDLIFVYLRARGVHIWDGFPCFLTEAHSEADVDFIIDAFKRSVADMQHAGFFPVARPSVVVQA